ncbi:ParA family protein [Myxococcota bacterium]|jgi:Mrp family chromosome partitioning ATPase|nr:ParA family protein [Myxococcota bacterium]
MADDRLPDRKRTGTYLFVRPKSARRARVTGSNDALPAVPTGGTPAPELAQPAEPPAPRLRYRRPRLEPRRLDARLLFFLSPDAPATEPYRQAAAVLGTEGSVQRRLWVVGAAPAVGATLTCANLGAALTEYGRVTLVDASRPGTPRRLTSLFGLDEPGAAYGVDHLDLWLLSDRLALKADGAVLAPTEGGQRAFQAIASTADFVLVDGLPADDPAVVGAMRSLVDAAVIVLRPADLGTGRYERTLDRLQGLPVAGILLNGAGDAVIET